MNAPESNKNPFSILRYLTMKSQKFTTISNLIKEIFRDFLKGIIVNAFDKTPTPKV
jgi:hypothetical protein